MNTLPRIGCFFAVHGLPLGSIHIGQIHSLRKPFYVGYNALSFFGKNRISTNVGRSAFGRNKSIIDFVCKLCGFYASFLCHIIVIGIEIITEINLNGRIGNGLADKFNGSTRRRGGAYNCIFVFLHNGSCCHFIGKTAKDDHHQNKCRKQEKQGACDPFFSFFLFAANSWFPFQKFIIQKQVSLFHSM